MDKEPQTRSGGVGGYEGLGDSGEHQQSGRLPAGGHQDPVQCDRGGVALWRATAVFLGSSCI